MVYIKIAEHIIKVVDCDSAKNIQTCSCGHDHHHDHSHDTFMAYIKQNFDLINSEELNDRKEDLTIYLMEQGYGESLSTYDVEITEKDNQKIYSRKDYLMKVDKDFKEVRLYAHNNLSLKHALMNMYSSFIVKHNWGLLMHASSIVEREAAHIFTGHSGAGKSTVAKLSSPRQLLSDEAAVIHITDEQVTIYHSPFRSELTERADKEVYPLADIQLLRQAKENKRVKMNQLKAYLELVDKVFFWTNDPNETTAVMKLLKRLVSSVPVYELYFEKNPSFWEVMGNEVHS
ncbi:MAG: hypothetical protein ACI35O_08205 [Bacillaceae bacterium]